MGKATSVQVGEALTGRPRQPGTGPWSLRVAPTHPGRAPATRPLGPSPALCLSLRLRHFPLVMDGNFPAWVKSDVSRAVVSHTLRLEADPA